MAREIVAGGEDRIQLSGLSAFYSHFQVLWDVDLSVDHGEAVGISGVNGAGKSTLLRAVVRGFGVVVHGEVAVDGVDVAGMRTEDICRLGVALVPADRRIYPLSVRDNIRLATKLKDWEELAAQFLDYFPFLKNRMRQRADTLSGGEQQALAIVRGLMSQPRYVLLDEPTEGLAPVVVDGLVAGLRGLAETTGIGMLIVEGNRERLQGLCDRILTLDRGRLTASDPTPESRMS